MGYRPADPQQEPHRVAIHKGEFADPARGGRAVPFKLYYPVAHDFAKLPVVIWSHGLGGGRDGAAFLSRFVAAHGYAVMNIQHAGSDTAIWEGKPGHPWDVIRAAEIPRSAAIDRFHDVPFVLDSLAGFAAAEPEIGALLDLTRIGMSGHSFGALTAQVMAGHPYRALDGGIARLREPRLVAGILYSFMPMQSLVEEDPAKICGAMELPLLFMTGTADANPITGQDYLYRLPVFEQAGSREKSLLVLRDGDHMVFAGSRGKLEVHPKRRLHEDIIKTLSLAWWDAYLKGDRAAKDWLTGAAAIPYLNGEATYEWRGDDRSDG